MRLEPGLQFLRALKFAARFLELVHFQQSQAEVVMSFSHLRLLADQLTVDVCGARRIALGGEHQPELHARIAVAWIEATASLSSAAASSSRFSRESANPRL